MNDPIHKSLTVPLTAAEAFALFTDDIDTWWPKASHSVKGERSKLTFPTHKGGEIIETDEDGETAVWGKLIAYDPGKYLAISWFPGRNEKDATVVTVTFTQTADGTLCELTHGGFDILGDTADAVSTSYLKGWDMVLGCYASAAKIPVHA
ncbi:SRPBCC domain-containing protein [Loktanella sp. Alg231-35]|uniref:SRPBCC domain-containing protein n=1 Tax=Loktanella sp. Alg231-35 TaxID=1922220 RepID=UPI000D56222E|nr:SRPBCC domain-containing protein [Loktanella sp. Alg231-35]